MGSFHLVLSDYYTQIQELLKFSFCDVITSILCLWHYKEYLLFRRGSRVHYPDTCDVHSFYRLCTEHLAVLTLLVKQKYGAGFRTTTYQLNNRLHAFLQTE